MKVLKDINVSTLAPTVLPKFFIETTFQDIEGCTNITDDILIFAKTQHEHDMTLETVLKRADAKKLRFNGDKWEFDKRNIIFYGHVFSKHVISPYPRKNQAIKSLNPLTNVSDLSKILQLWLHHYVNLQRKRPNLNGKNPNSVRSLNFKRH